MTTFAIAASTSPTHLIISIKTSCSSLIISPTPNILNHSLCFLKLCNVAESFLRGFFMRTMGTGSLSYQPFSAYPLTYPCTFVCKCIRLKKKKSPHFFIVFTPEAAQNDYFDPDQNSFVLFTAWVRK